MTTRRRLLLAIFCAVAALLAAMSFAWACGPQPHIALDPASGAVGTTVSVTGQNFKEGALEVRWNTANGPLLATASGPEFSTQVTIPDASDGSYVIMGVQYDENGDFDGTPGRATFEVKSAAEEPPPDNGGSEPPPQEPNEPREPREPRSPSEPRGPRETRNAPPSASTSPRSSSVGAGDQDDVSFAGSAVVDSKTRPGDTRRKATATTERPDAVRRGLESSVWGELWNGFDPIDGTGPRLGAAPERQEPAWQPLIGVIALGVGLVLMMAGFLIATVRRRRVRVPGEDT